MKSNSEMMSLAITAIKDLYQTEEKEYAGELTFLHNQRLPVKTWDYALFVKSPGLS